MCVPDNGRWCNIRMISVILLEQFCVVLLGEVTVAEQCINLDESEYGLTEATLTFRV